MISDQNKINSIQALRGFAALLVVMFHFRGEINKTFPHIGDTLFINGSMGVDLFFLISGFIVFYVARNLNDGVNSSKEFFIKRMCRIIPPYYLITLCVAGSSVESWLETLRSMLFIPLDGKVVGPVYGYARLDVGWTLNYEFLFYALSTFAIFFKKQKWFVLSAVIFCLTIIPSFYFGWNGLNPTIGYNFNNVYLKLMTNPLILEFIMGIFIGWTYSIDIKIKSKFFWILTLSFSSAFFLYIYFSGALWGNSPRAFMIPCALLLFSVIEYEKRYGINWPNWIINTGAISFSIYLIHVQALSVVSKLTGRMVKVGIPLPGIVIALLAIFLTVFLAKLSYRYIEVGLSNRIRNALLPKNKQRKSLTQQA